VRIPGAKKAVIQEIEQVKTDSVPTIVEEAPALIEKSIGYTPVKDLKGSLDVAVLLPFCLKETLQEQRLIHLWLLKAGKLTR